MDARAREMRLKFRPLPSKIWSHRGISAEYVLKFDEVKPSGEPVLRGRKGIPRLQQ